MRMFTVAAFIRYVPETRWEESADIPLDQVGASVQAMLNEEPRIIRVVVREQIVEEK